MSEVQPIFVFGSARSGTTMMGNLLSSAESFHTYRAETMLMSVCRKRYGNIFNDIKKKQKFLEDWFSSRQFARSNLDESEFTNLVNESKSYEDLLVRFLEAMALKNNKKFIVDSTPANIDYLKKIASHCHYAKFVWVIRDGRDVSLSQEKLGWVNPPYPFKSKVDRLSYTLINWKLANTQDTSFISERLFIVKYEDFLKNPNTVLEKLAKFIGLEGNNFDLERTLNAGHSNSAFGKLGDKSNKSALYRWENVDKKMVMDFTYGCTDQLSYFHYPTQKSRLKLKNFLRYHFFNTHIKLKKKLTSHHFFSRLTSDYLEKNKN